MDDRITKSYKILIVILIIAILATSIDAYKRRIPRRGGGTPTSTSSSECLPITPTYTLSRAHAKFDNRTINLTLLNFKIPLSEINYSFITKLQNDSFKSGIGNRTYVANTYDCDDFASDLENYLDGLGYNATFTTIRAYRIINNSLYTRGAHAVTDVHLSDGSVVFLDPQSTENKSRLFPDYDLNNDVFEGVLYNVRNATINITRGLTEITNNRTLGVGYIIHTYKDRRTAEAAGERLD